MESFAPRPETRTTAMPPRPGGVERAKMVSVMTDLFLLPCIVVRHVDAHLAPEHLLHFAPAGHGRGQPCFDKGFRVEAADILLHLGLDLFHHPVLHPGYAGQTDELP